jgi:hypothetical protein
MLSKAFAKHHSVPGVVRDIPITISDTAGNIVPGVGASHTEPVILRHKEHFTIETFEIAPLDDRIDAVLPFAWLEQHEIIGLQSGHLYFGSAFCMQNCTKKRLQMDSNQPKATARGFSPPLPSKSPLPSSKPSNMGKVKAVTVAKSYIGLTAAAGATTPSGKTTASTGATKGVTPRVPKAYIAPSGPSTPGPPRALAPPGRPTTPFAGARSTSGQKRVPSGAKPPTPPLAINSARKSPAPATSRKLSPPKSIPSRAKSPVKDTQLLKTPTKVSKSPTAASKLPRFAKSPAKPKLSTVDVSAKLREGNVSASSIKSASKPSEHRVHAPEADLEKGMDVRDERCAESTDGYDSDASSEFEEHPGGIRIESQNYRSDGGEVAGTKSDDGGGDVIAASVEAVEAK